MQFHLFCRNTFCGVCWCKVLLVSCTGKKLGVNRLRDKKGVQIGSWYNPHRSLCTLGINGCNGGATQTCSAAKSTCDWSAFTPRGAELGGVGRSSTFLGLFEMRKVTKFIDFCRLSTETSSFVTFLINQATSKKRSCGPLCGNNKTKGTGHTWQKSNLKRELTVGFGWRGRGFHWKNKRFRRNTWAVSIFCGRIECVVIGRRQCQLENKCPMEL